MKMWIVAWTDSSGKKGETEPIPTEAEAVNWETRMRAWWPERKFRRVAIETKPEPSHNLAGPYLKS
jgi:hypothetical protein